MWKAQLTGQWETHGWAQAVAFSSLTGRDFLSPFFFSFSSLCPSLPPFQKGSHYVAHTGLILLPQPEFFGWQTCTVIVSSELLAVSDLAAAGADRCPVEH